MYRLSEVHRQSSDKMANYICTGTEQNLNDCFFDIGGNVCQLPGSTVVICSKSLLFCILYVEYMH